MTFFSLFLVVQSALEVGYETPCIYPRFYLIDASLQEHKTNGLYWLLASIGVNSCSQ